MGREAHEKQVRPTRPDGLALPGIERSFRDIYEHVTEGIYHSSLDGKQLGANPALVRLNGYETEAELLTCVNDIATEWYVDPHRRAEFQRRLATEGRVEDFVSEIYRHRTRERIWISENARMVCDPVTGEPRYYEGTVREITETMRRLALEERHCKIAQAFPGCLFQLRQHRRAISLTYGSVGLERLCGIAPAALARDACGFVALVHPEDRRGVFRGFLKAARTLSRWTQEFRIRLDGGRDVWVLGDATPEREADGPTLWHGYLVDIGRRKKAEQSAQDLAFFDPLTRLPNRRCLLDRLDDACAAHGRHGHHAAVLFIDLDNFKLLNDTRGHAAGDLLLVEVARRLESCVRELDTVARLGGDEFVVLLRGHAGEDAAEGGVAEWARIVGERILATVGQPFLLGGQVFQTTPSIGAAVLSGPPADPQTLLQQADIAMYQAKAAGRNRLCFFEPAMQVRLQTRVTLVEALGTALPNHELRLRYQPQFDRDRRLVGAEALLRWQHEQRGLVLPDAFIAVAEETGLILPISDWVLRETCVASRAWQDDACLPVIRFAVNVSPRQLRAADFVASVMAVIDATGIHAGRLVLELTERVMLDDPLCVARSVRALSELGVRFALDDFGTGFSSFGRLRDLHIDQIKIDRSFVRDLERSARDRTLVRTMIGMARNLGMEVVAEGVETPEQMRILRDEGCDVFQGYLLGKPRPFERLAGFATSASPAG